MNQTFGNEPRPSVPQFTQLQGQYLASIYAYTRIFKRPLAEADMHGHFEVTAPSVHQMVLTLEKAGLIQLVATAAIPLFRQCCSEYPKGPKRRFDLNA